MATPVRSVPVSAATLRTSSGLPSSVTRATPSLRIFALACTVRGSVPSGSTMCFTSALALALIFSIADMFFSSLMC